TGNHTEEPAPAMLAVWNPLSFLRSGIVEIGGAAAGQAGLIQEDNGEKHSAYGQISEDGTLLVPVWDAAPKGLKIYEAPALLEKNGAVLSAGPEEFVLWNLQEQDGRIKGFDTAYYEIRLNENGELTSVFDKKRERQVLSAGQAGNRLLAFEDRPEEYDAWNIDAYYEEKQWVVEGLSECRVTENGPLRGCISIRRTFLKSVIEQQIYFYRHTGRIDFKTRIDWKESQILLKAAFPVDVLTDKAVYDVQFGNVERPTHRNTSWEQAKFEVCAHKWADVSEAGYGVALMNDCKYGYDIRESVMRLTLLKSGIFPNPTADQEVHTFTYSLYPHDGDFRTGGVVQEAYDLNCPLQAVPVREKTAEPGEGRAWNGENRSSAFCVAVDAENVLADTVKKAEDGDGITLRLYETYGKRTRTRVTVPASAGKQAEDCDCMEQPLGRLELEDGAISLEFRPYEIKTIRIR
ncbi:MAG: glycoside hydrolase family 38 C-terminal domain-containing protein, partial [Lachnospiraceae bacterium]|nr:glycoside hydrolase family 38 C-terminal domain-containing protein [Lachnospiraceae bacterium]